MSQPKKPVTAAAPSVVDGSPLRVYLAGGGMVMPDSDTCRKYNDVAREMRRHGFDVYNPCDHEWQEHIENAFVRDALRGGPYGEVRYADYMLLRSLMQLSLCDVVLLLPCWRGMPRAWSERYTGRAMGKLVVEYGTTNPTTWAGRVKLRGDQNPVRP